MALHETTKLFTDMPLSLLLASRGDRKRRTGKRMNIIGMGSKTR